MALYIMTDSAADAENINRDDFVVLPLTVRFGDTEYLDCKNLTKKEFYEKLVECEELPITSQITPFSYEEAIMPYVEAGDQVLVITLSSKLSGTWQNAAMLANEYPEQVFVVDSLNASLGQRILVDYALRLKDEGKSVTEIVEVIEKAKHKVHFVALLDTLEYLQKGGRISKVAAIAGNLLSIKPVIAVEGGAVNVLGKARGTKQGNNMIADQIKSRGEIDISLPMYLGYTGLDDSKIKKYREERVELWNGNENVPIMIVGCAIGTHIGPGAIGAAWIEK